MTIFRPQEMDEIWGMRFWSGQFVKYAGYTNHDKEGTILGDPANVEITNFLVDHNFWVPPSPRSAFDVLPLVLKIPHNEVLFVQELPKEVIHEVSLEHPEYPQVKELNYKWAAVPAISNFMMNLGGIKYPCSPFNGWFLSTEIVRNLLERYNASAPLAEAFGINPHDRMLQQKVTVELETAVLHSFEKNDFTIVDPMASGKSFMTHCKRERKMGRECPAQWSWIGGLVGTYD
jgi:nitric oxide synthase oxygenase domain/subunit